MRDKRPVDELTIEELERVLAIKRREARKAQMARMQREGRIASSAPPPGTNGAQPKPAAKLDLPPGLAVDEDGVRLMTDDDVPTETPAPAPVQQPKPAPKTPAPRVAPPPIDGSSAVYFEDDAYDVDPLRQRRLQEAERAWRRFVNSSTILIEVVAVVGLLVLGFLLLGERDEYRDESNQLQEELNATRIASIPTLEPTAVLRVDVNDWVLPGGHTSDGGQPIYNLAELREADIPAHLLPEVQQQLITPVIERPPRTPETALYVNIPKLNIEQTIVQGADWEALKQGVGQVINGARPGDETGNVVLAAHNDIYGELFRNLDELDVGDEFTIRTESNIYTYVITGYDVVEPTQVEVLRNSGIPTATLISCYPHGQNTHRIVIFAERVDL